MITIVGSGKVGVSAAVTMAMMELDDILLIDIIEGRPQGEALDLGHMASILGLSIDIRGSNDYKDMEGSDIVIVPAGFPRKADMTREELVNKNVGVMESVGNAIKEYAPNAVVILTTNPVDTMAYVMWKVTGFPKNRVIGFSGVLDSGRLRYYIAKELGLSPASIIPIVLGQHGQKMVPLPRHSLVYGKPVTEMLSKEKIDELVQKTIGAGKRIIELRGWSSNHAPGAGLAMMAKAVKLDQKKIVLASALLEGEYGVSGVFAGVPVVLGKNGIEKIIELDLNDEEKKLFMESVEAIKANMSSLPDKYK
ncbi:MAG: malate dehydrogenase [Candidatus Njordarchaeia archaeon]